MFPNYVTLCEHLFHKICIERRLYLNNSCPICINTNIDMDTSLTTTIEDDELDFGNQIQTPRTSSVNGYDQRLACQTNAKRRIEDIYQKLQQFSPIH